MSDFSKQRQEVIIGLEAQLVSELRAGDQAVMGRIYDAYGPTLYGIALKIVGEQIFAEDVLQDTFVKIWRFRENFDPQKGRFFTWMLNICRNTAIDFIRKKIGNDN